jgi:tetratricopeptide (TPR) repeat protein
MLDDDPVRLPPRVMALCACFVFRDTDRLDRSYLASLLWPEASHRSARHSLSQAVYALKQACKNRIRISGSNTEILVSGFTSDANEFLAAVSRTDWLEAERLYRGDPLSGLDVAGAEEFHDWVHGVRVHYWGLASTVCTALRLEGQLTAAASLAARLPSEVSQVGLDGQVESSRPTNPELDEGREAPGLWGEPAAFVGRREEMARLEGWFFGELSGGFTGAIISGEPGIGKSALANRFARLCALRSVRVVSARGFSAEQNVPFGIVAQWIRQFAPRELAQLGSPWREILNDAFPGLAGLASRLGEHPRVESSPYRLLESLRQLLLSVSRESPVLLLLDDAHVADPGSMGFVHYLARRSADAAVMFLATIRSPLLYGDDPFMDWALVNRLPLGPLTLEETTTLLNRLVPPETARQEDVAAIARRTGRNPLLMLALLSSGSTGEGAPVPESVVAFFIPWLASLSRDAELLLSAMAIADENFDIGLVAEIAGVEESTTLAMAVSELTKASLLFTETDGNVRPRHGIVAEICESRLAEVDRKTLYGRAARVLGERGRSSPAVLAVQHDIAGDRSRAFEAALKAADASKELHAQREREYFLKLALSNAPDIPTEADIRIQLADLFRAVGRMREASDIISANAIECAPVRLQHRARARRLAIRLVSADDRATSDEQWREIELISDVIEPHVTAELYVHFASAAHDFGNHRYIIEAANRAMAFVDVSPTTPGTTIAAIKAAKVLGLYCGVQEGVDAIERLKPVARATGEVLGHWLSAYATLLVAAGRLVEAEARFLEAIELIERYCQYGALYSLHNNLGVCYTEQGRFAEAMARFAATSQAAKEFGGPGDVAMVGDNMAVLYFESGTLEESLATARAAVSNGSRSSRGLFHRHAIIGLCSLELGLLAQAFEAKREIELLLDQHQYWSSDVSYVEMFLAKMLVMEGAEASAQLRLSKAIEVYKPRDLMCRARLELELGRVQLKHDPGASLRRGTAMLTLLRGTGARPLIDRFEDLVVRARARLNAV